MEANFGLRRWKGGEFGRGPEHLVLAALIRKGRRRKRDINRNMAEALPKLCSSAPAVSPTMWGGVFEGWEGLLARYGC